MSVVHPPDSAYAKEMTKWEAQGSTLGPGLRPYVRRDYPMMLHKAASPPQGGIVIAETRIVEDEAHRTLAERDDFRATPLEAIAVLQRRQAEAAFAAAVRNHDRLHMSAGANREIDRAEEQAGAVHLVEIPETPLPPRAPDGSA